MGLVVGIVPPGRRRQSRTPSLECLGGIIRELRPQRVTTQFETGGAGGGGGAAGDVASNGCAIVSLGRLTIQQIPERLPRLAVRPIAREDAAGTPRPLRRVRGHGAFRAPAERTWRCSGAEGRGWVARSDPFLEKLRPRSRPKPMVPTAS